jgi:hypothetical protein
MISCFGRPSSSAARLSFFPAEAGTRANSATVSSVGEANPKHVDRFDYEAEDDALARLV